ncbi:MAG: 50S ribosomal protein L18 [Clostridiales bacterium]|nr:50S ribosomal protein L18 [Clostridiales bacterium]
MIKKASRKEARVKRHYRLRNKISGTSDCPRLCVFRSSRHIYAQIIDDTAGNTIAAASTMEKAVSAALKNTFNIEAAKAVGAAVAQKAAAKGVKAVVFDRGGYLYHGKVKALADSARAAGLEF